MVEKVLGQAQTMVGVKTKWTARMTVFEKVTAALVFSICVLLMFGAVYTRTLVDSVNQNIETVRTDTKTVSNDNQILQQKIDSLMTTERIEAVAKAYGLTRDINNVRSVNK